MSKLADMIARMPIYQNVRCGVDVGDGWVPIVERLGEQLADLGGVTVTQVKEKFGGLRVYHESSDYDTAEALIRTAEEECARTCENCGAAGSRRGGGWILTLCDGCHESRQERRRALG